MKDLKNLHTKQLLKMLNSTYQVPPSVDSWGDRINTDENRAEYLVKQEALREEIKAVLATREHVLNKTESYEVRHQKKKLGKKKPKFVR